MNTQVSSEMLVSVMSILHERLPCSQYYFRQRALFKDRQIQKQSKNIMPLHLADQSEEKVAAVMA